MAIIIKADGKTKHTEPINGKVFTLNELQTVVGGYIEIVPITTGEYTGKLLVVDEEGKLKADAQLNIEASKISGQQIVGQVIVIDRDQIE